MNEKKDESKLLEKRESRVKCPPNLEAVYDPKTGAFIGRRPIELKEIEPITKKEKDSNEN